jgi:hypothetical protein
MAQAQPANSITSGRRSTPPFRADHVGSLLRPQRLLRAREEFAAGILPAEQLRAAEDDAIRDVVKMQRDVGLQSATDGEFRRGSRLISGQLRSRWAIVAHTNGDYYQRRYSRPARAARGQPAWRWPSGRESARRGWQRLRWDCAPSAAGRSAALSRRPTSSRPRRSRNADGRSPTSAPALTAAIPADRRRRDGQEGEAQGAPAARPQQTGRASARCRAQHADRARRQAEAGAAASCEDRSQAVATTEP